MISILKKEQQKKEGQADINNILFLIIQIPLHLCGGFLLNKFNRE